MRITYDELNTQIKRLERDLEQATSQDEINHLSKALLFAEEKMAHTIDKGRR